MKKPTLLAGGLLAVVFTAGAAAGVAGDRWLSPSAESGVRVTRDFSTILDELDLGTDQRRQAQTLLEQSAPRSEAILRDVAEQLQQVADSVDAELRELLSPTQRAKLDSLRRGPLFVIKRKSSGGTTVDTVARPNP